MTIFVWEYCCAAAPDAPESLRREGRAMLTALRHDFERCPGVEVVAVADGLAQEMEAFRRLSRSSDWTLVIAPETDGILYERCRIVEEVSGRLLGPDSAAVLLAGDKWKLAQHLTSQGVPTPPCELLRPGVALSWPFPLVCKPRDGAGSQSTFLLRAESEICGCLRCARAEGFLGELIVQPFVPGRAVSVAFLIGPGGWLALPAAEQRLSDDGRFHYHGGRLPLEPDDAERARRLAERALSCVTGLRGYVGVDLVLGVTADHDRVIEINPRLTTSYLGLRQLANENLAAALLAQVVGETPTLTWRGGPVVFSAGGECV